MEAPQPPPGFDVLFLTAAGNGNLPVIRELAARFENGEGPGKIPYAKLKTPAGYNALHLAADAGKTVVCRFLIEKLSFDINASSEEEGETPLILAVAEGHIPTTSFLISNDADVTKRIKFGVTALHYAAKSGSKEIVEMLISKEADLNAISDLGTPLHFAAHGNSDTLKCLLEHVADPNPSLPSMDMSPLMFSLFSKSFECMELLLKAGADPNCISYAGTPLSYAAAALDEGFIRRLLEAGANPNLISAGDHTPLEHAALLGRPEVVELLFPVTSRIARYPDWSSRGVMRYFHSEEAREQLDSKMKDSVLNGNTKGGEAFKRKNYVDAISWYTQAVASDRTDAKALSNRSLCYAKLNIGSEALEDAQACVRLEPGWAKAHYREGAAWQLLKDFKKASESFSRALALEPDNKEIESAYRAAQAEHDKRGN